MTSSNDDDPFAGAAVDLTDMTQAIGDVQAKLAGLAQPAIDSAKTLESAFTRSFDTLGSQLSRAAANGTLSFHGMVDAILADLARLAINTFIAKPIEGLVENLFDFGGARAMGGPVAAGRPYLVGENGPELFTPSVHGSIAANGSGGGTGRPSVTVNVQARDAQSFLRSEGQVAAMLNRAMARGARNL